MEVRHLELLRELSVRGTLAAVAEATHRTPSALSQQLRSAERELGVRLVEPVSRGIRLTAEGQLLADSADEVCRALAAVQARLDAMAGEPRGTVRIGTLPSAGEALLPGLVTRLRDSQISLDIDDFDLAEADFAARALDADIVIAHSLTGDVPAGAEGLTCTVIARETLDVALPADHPLADRAVLAPQDLIGTTWVGVPAGYPFDTILLTVERITGHALHRRIRLRDNRLVESLVAAGVGLAVLPRFTTSPRCGVVLRPLTGLHADRSVVALSRPDRYARLAVRAVVDILAEIGEALSARQA
ncbi:LysR family transcriptional regulator [Hoyosella sp. YIM 151337]|uniref:LysR family transcriptional regulator n=1 Tax=Hoyosella sp. YIM 151337 TaxID=2992742 RepID=UPI0022361F9F|nr:LysR family transcriptional regulator [Hoyosella sp. YIM 151337]MCW4351819.1 LysR family transcriptional regulator [Hoyosella sp. YIM 151337]